MGMRMSPTISYAVFYICIFGTFSISRGALESCCRVFSCSKILLTTFAQSASSVGNRPSH